VSEAGRVIATPLGNLQDITLRALALLPAVDWVAAEDTRATRRLLAAHGLKARLLAYHEHNEGPMAVRLVTRLLAGESGALVSDAGTPGVSDPGARLVAAALAAGVSVLAVPGPSAVAAALSVSGFSADRYVFLGFPPRKGRERREHLTRAAREDLTVVLFEAPHRIARTLAELAVLASERPAVVLRELTKLFEESRRGTLGELAPAVAAGPTRGEYTVVLGPVASAPVAASLDSAVARARALMGQGVPPAEAAREAARATGCHRRDVYRALIAALPAAPVGDEE